MSCPNFHKVNARNYYVVTPYTTRLDVDTEEEVDALKDDIDYDFDIECAQDRGIEKGYDSVQIWHNEKMGRSIMQKKEWFSFGKRSDHLSFNQFEINRYIHVHSGYYSGMNYDWDIEVNWNCGDCYYLSDYDSVEDMVEDIADAWQEVASDTWYDGWNVGMTKIQKKNLKKWLLKMIDKFSDEADDMCRDICEDVYVCGGIFSNGEAVYYKEDSLKGKACNVESA